MNTLKACTVCFNTDIKLYTLDAELKHEFLLLSGLGVSSSELLNYLCYQCLACLKSCKRFRDKCQQAFYTLQEIWNKNKTITQSDLNNVNKHLNKTMPLLSYMSLDRAYFEAITYNIQWKKQQQTSCTEKSYSIPILYCNVSGDIETNEYRKINEKQNTDSRIMTKEVNFEEAVASIDNENLISDYEQELNNITCKVEKDSDVDRSDLEELADLNIDNGSYNAEEYNNIELDNTICAIDKVNDTPILEEEYATMYPLSIKEAKAVIEVCKAFGTGEHHCTICNKAYVSENQLKLHMRQHDKHISGLYHCEVCDYYYKTELLLNTHITDKHKYKYVCKKCPEVNFERTTAKKHFKMAHLQILKRNNKTIWCQPRPSWLRKKNKKTARNNDMVKKRKVPEDFFIRTPIGHEEQYLLVEQRQHTQNYTDAPYKCEMCYKYFNSMTTYTNHMNKHNPNIAGPLQCDVCKLHFKTHLKMYSHMIRSHIFNYSCRLCSYVTCDIGTTEAHYKWHLNIKYECPHCNKEFTKLSTRLTHIRVNHPSMNICNLCGHSYVSESGLNFHKRLAHNKEEIEQSSTLIVDKSSPTYCGECDMQFVNEFAFDTHLGSSYKHTSTNTSTMKSRKRVTNKNSGNRRGKNTEIFNKGRAIPSHCEVCNIVLANDVQARKHYESEHPDTEFLKRYMCDVCGHTTKLYGNLISHMRRIHTEEMPYTCPHCDRRFNNSSNRDRHLSVHTDEKPYQCEQCPARFKRIENRKFHVRTVHLKIPYVRKNKRRRQRKEEKPANVTAATTTLPKCDIQSDYLNAYITYKLQ